MGNDEKKKGPISFSLTGHMVLMAGVFALVVLGAVSHTDNPSKYIFSPITIITILAVFLAFSGAIKLNALTLLIIIGLVFLTMYQDHLDEFLKELKWDWLYVKREFQKLTKSGAYSPDTKEKIVAEFNKKYAQKITDTNYYVYVKQVDDYVKGIVGHDTWTHNYFLVILPEIKSISEGTPLADTPTERITLYAIKHEAEVPIVVDNQVYTVVAKAYLIRLNMFEEIATILDWLGCNLECQISLTQLGPWFIATNFLDYHARLHGTNPYDSFVNKLEEHKYEIPDTLYIKG